MAADGVYHLAQGRPQMLRFVAYHGDAQRDQLAVILILHFGDGDVKTVPQSILDALHHLPFILERTRLPDDHAYFQRTDEHGHFIWSPSPRYSGERGEIRAYVAPVRRDTPRS